MSALERTVELAEVRLHLRDWPGFAGPLVHVPDPLSADDRLIDALASAFAPRFRVFSLQPRGNSFYQVDTADLRAVLDQFGFAHPVLVGERLGCVAAALLAAWHPDHVAGLVLLDPVFTAPSSGGVFARSLKDCPPDWPALRGAVKCPVLEVPPASAVEDLETFLAQFVPVRT